MENIVLTYDQLELQSVLWNEFVSQGPTVLYLFVFYDNQQTHNKYHNSIYHNTLFV
jgi:hypothetical protein